MSIWYARTSITIEVIVLLPIHIKQYSEIQFLFRSGLDA